jgi:hypothetical protein
MTENPNEPAVPPDPIYQKSYSVHILVASVALVGAVALAIADEIWLRRPYKAIQHEYREATLAYLRKVEGERMDFDRALRALDEFRALDQAVADAESATQSSKDALTAEFHDLSAEADALKETVKSHRSEMDALRYDGEVVAHHAGENDVAKSAAARPYLEAIEKVKARKLDYSFTRASGEVVKASGTAGDLIARFIAMQGEKGKKQEELGRALAPVSAARKARDEWLAANLASIRQFYEAPRVADGEGGEPATSADAMKQEIGKRIAEVGVQRYLDEYAVTVAPDVVAKLREKLERMPTDPIRGGEIQQYQIHIKDSNNWVDRCEVCHLGARSVVPVAEDALASAVAAEGWSKDRIEKADLKLFASHPRSAELFANHDPEKVGCSTCHNGNGIAITSTFLAHGENHHWLWPLHPKENIEAGCLQCHQQDIHLPGGPRISEARQSFFDRGCWGCHPYEGHDKPTAEIKKLDAQIADLRREQATKVQRQAALRDAALATPDDTPAQTAALDAANAERAKLQEEISQLETEIQGFVRRTASLHQERERVGPNLKDLKVAMRPEVITPWVQDPTHVRADTKMPVFRWWGATDANGLNEEAKDVAAYLWQNSLDPSEFPEYALKAPPGGSAGRGKELLEKVGCLACHAVERDGKKVGKGWAANLSAVGDKKTYEWMFRWIKDPQHRIVPYSVRTGKDLTAAEAAQEDPATLVWRQPTRMPSLRLSDDDARDIATYLVSLRSDRKWPEAPWLAEKERFARGRDLVVYSGCAGCHEIRGLENERGIGTELTKEGSKPLDKLDFGHVTTAAKRGEEPIPGMRDWTAADGAKPFADMYGTEHGWYRQRGYFMHKLAKPDIYDTSKYFTERFVRSRMPTFRLTGHELHDLTTFLLGSVDSRLPKSSTFNPDETGQAVREGWWLLKKYNCQGCHPVEPGDRPAFWDLPWWAPDEKRDRVMPPTLVGEGFRVRPDWLAEFLHDPSLGGGTAHPKSVRNHLDVRMPTYSFTEHEVATLVRFFAAMAKQPFVYQAPKHVPLSAAEKKAAEAIWAGNAANCLQCHVTGDMPVTTETKGPNLSYAARRLRPEWMARWIPNPPAMQPWTAMTVNFKREVEGDPKSRWVYNNPDLPELKGVRADHVDLMIRWLQELTPAR